jgi:prophage antirepressor-like protein
MTNIIPYDFNGQRLQVLVDEHGEPWFIAMEVADILGYSDAYEMTKRLDDDEKSNRQIAGLGTATGGRGVTIINESGLYSSILGSSKPEAKPFKRWVTGEVLPSIRRTGSYSRPMTPAEQLLASVQLTVELERRQQHTEQQVAALVETVSDMDRAHPLLDSIPNGMESITAIRHRIGKQYGLPPRVIDAVVREMPHSPRPFAMVRSKHEELNARPFAVWSKAEISRVFERFAQGCTFVTRFRATHPDFQGGQERFQMRGEPAGEVEE